MSKKITSTNIRIKGSETMNSQIKVLPRHLRSLANQMRNANSQSLDQIKAAIKKSKAMNEQVASNLASRKRILHDTMMDRLNTIGLQSLISSFTNSYNQLELQKHTLRNATSQPLPTSMIERFFARNRAVLPNNIADTRWSVGGRRWERTFSSGENDLRTHYNNADSAITRMIGQVESQLTILDNFSKRGHDVGGVGRAASALLSVLNYVSETMIEVVPEGIGSSRAGHLDAIPETIANVLEVFERHIEIAIAASLERATQTDALADAREADDAATTSLFQNEASHVNLESLIRSSQVEFAIYRPDLLSDNKGIESARQEQHEQRFEDLKTSLTSNLFPVVDFLASRADSMWTNVSQMCTHALTAISNLETFLNQAVTVEVREREERPSRNGGTTQIDRWERRGIAALTLGDYLPEIVETIRSAKRILEDWERDFRTMTTRASELRDAINRNDHIGQLSERTAKAIYLLAPYDNLQTFASQARENLENLASAYQGCANQLRSHMSGAAIIACTREIDNTAKYFRAIAQALEKDFGNGDFSGAVNRLNSFPVRCSTRLVWSRKTAEELMEMLIVDGEVQWELLEYLLGQPYDNITDAQFTVFAQIYAHLDDLEEVSRFLAALAEPATWTDPHTGVVTTLLDTDPPMWMHCPRKMERLGRTIAQNELAPLFAEMLALDPMNEDYTKDYTKLRERYYRLLMRIGLLDVVSQLTHVCSDGNHWFIAGDQNGPVIDVVPTDSNSNNLSIHYDVGMLSPTNHATVRFETGGPTEGIINLTWPRSESGLTGGVLDNAETFLRSHYTSNGTPPLWFQTVLFLATLGVQEALGPVSVLYDFLTSLDGGTPLEENPDFLRAISGIHDAQSANRYAWAGMSVIVVSRPEGQGTIEPLSFSSGSQQMIPFPTGNTQRQLDRMNLVISNNPDINLADHGLPDPVTLIDLYNPEHLESLFNIYDLHFEDYQQRIIGGDQAPPAEWGNNND